MYIVHKLLATKMTILFIILLSSLSVNAAEMRYFELPNPADIKPPPSPGGDNLPNVSVRKSSKMRSPRARNNIPIIKEQIQRLGYPPVSG